MPHAWRQYVLVLVQVMLLLDVCHLTTVATATTGSQTVAPPPPSKTQPPTKSPTLLPPTATKTLSPTPSPELTATDNNTETISLSRRVTLTETLSETMTASEGSGSHSFTGEATMSVSVSDEATMSASTSPSETITYTPPPTRTKSCSLSDEATMSESKLTVTQSFDTSTTMTQEVTDTETNTFSLPSSQTLTDTVPVTPSTTIPYFTFVDGRDMVFEDAIVTGEPIEDRTVILQLHSDSLDLVKANQNGGHTWLYDCIEFDLASAPSVQHVFNNIFAPNSVVSNNQSQYLTIIFQPDERMWLEARKPENVSLSIHSRCVLGETGMNSATIMMVPGSSSVTQAPPHVAHKLVDSSSPAALSVGVAAAFVKSSPTLALNLPRTIGLASLLECQTMADGLTIFEHPTRYNVRLGSKADLTSPFLGALLMNLAIVATCVFLHLVVVLSMLAKYYKHTTGQRVSYSTACAAFPSRSIYVMLFFAPVCKCVTVLGFSAGGDDTWLLVSTIAAFLPWIISVIFFVWVVFLAPVYAYTKRVPKRSPFDGPSDEDEGDEANDGVKLRPVSKLKEADASLVDAREVSYSRNSDTADGLDPFLLNDGDRGAGPGAYHDEPKPPTGNFFIEFYRRFCMPDQLWVWKRQDPQQHSRFAAAVVHGRRNHHHVNMATYHYFVDRFECFFGDYVGRYYWWFFLEMLVTLIASFAEGISTASATSCAQSLWLMVALYFLYMCAVARTRPHNVPYQKIVYLLNATLVFTAALLGAMAHEYDWPGIRESGQIVLATSYVLLMADAAFQLILTIGTGIAWNLRKGKSKLGHVDLVTVRRADGKIAKGRDYNPAVVGPKQATNFRSPAGNAGAIPSGATAVSMGSSAGRYHPHAPPSILKDSSRRGAGGAGAVETSDFSPSPTRPVNGGSPVARRVSFTAKDHPPPPPPPPPPPREVPPPPPPPAHPILSLPARHSPGNAGHHHQGIGFGGRASVPVPPPRHSKYAPLQPHSRGPPQPPPPQQQGVPAPPPPPPQRSSINMYTDVTPSAHHRRPPSSYWSDDEEEDLSVYL